MGEFLLFSFVLLGFYLVFLYLSMDLHSNPNTHTRLLIATPLMITSGFCTFIYPKCFECSLLARTYAFSPPQLTRCTAVHIWCEQQYHIVCKCGISMHNSTKNNNKFDIMYLLYATTSCAVYEWMYV